MKLLRNKINPADPESGKLFISLLSESCRYANCSHEHESGCAVRAAIKDGALNEDRYASFIKLKKESEYYEMSYRDKRKKDRAFGRFMKSAKKQTTD